MSGRHTSGAPVDAPASSDDSLVHPGAPLLRVLAGEPTPDELAAVTALLAAIEAGRAPAAAATTRPSVSAWTRSARAPRPTVVPGDGRWRGFAG